MSVTSWFLVSSGGTRHRLPREMIFVGRDDCELMLQSRSVDKQHAVINYEAATDEHKVKDLGSLNGTFVNDVRIQEQMYITLKLEDKLRFGYDTNLFTVVKGELMVPEEALKHEKFTSGLQLSHKPGSGDAHTSAHKPPAKTPTKAARSDSQSKPVDTHKAEERTGADATVLPRGTPLYGQPSWWGDGDADDENSFKQESKSTKKQDGSLSGRPTNGSETDCQSVVAAFVVLCDLASSQTSNYFEIPTKDAHMANNGIHEIPTKDTDGGVAPTSTAQGHASFTIEFDNASPGKVTIKDHVSKFTPDQHRPRSKKSGAGSAGAGGRDLTTLQAAMMASECKVADWLAHNDPTVVRSESTEDDSKSIKSDVPVHLKRLKGSKHEDGTQSDSENGLGLRFANRRHALEERLKAAHSHIRPQTRVKKLQWSHVDPVLVFGVQQNQDSSFISDPKGGKGKEISDTSKSRSDRGRRARPPGPHHTGEGTAFPGDSSWVSQWASIAANHTRTDPEGSGAETANFLHKETGDAFESGASLSRGESSSSLTERKRRTLPQPPADDSRAKSNAKAAGQRSEIGEKQDTEPQEKEHKADEECPLPHSHSEMSGKRNQSSTSSPSKAPLRASGSSERRKRSEERKGGAGEGGEKAEKPLVRQGSFTIEKPSGSVPAELIPRINRSGGGRERSDSVGSMDTATLLKDTEAVMAFLEAKLRDENKQDKKSSKTGLPPQGSSGFPPRTDSISPESDVDTASTASHAAAEAEKKASAGGELKRRSLSSMHREKSNMSTASRSSAASASASARERLERKSKSRTAEAASRDARRSTQPSSASSRARQPSLDLTDDDQTSSFPVSDILSSDQETYSGSLGPSKSDGRSALTSTNACKAGRSLQAATTSSLNKQASLPQPRPTRASLLRRARLGDASDTDLADADRVSVASEVSTTSSTSKPPPSRKGLSRLDMLAQPRRNRLGSISARSDSECTVTRAGASSSRMSAETALRLGLRSSTPTENKLTPRMRANSVSKLTETKTKAVTSGYCSPTVSSSSRWRRLPPEYGSTSEEEFGSGRNAPKHGGRPHARPHHLVPHRSSRLSTAAAPGVGAGGLAAPGGVAVKHRMKEQEEYIRDWTAHSEEIARISQDLAKDLAILAREIHDVAGEIDSVSSSGTAPSTTVSTAATTPGSAIDTREESTQLVDRVFDESLNFRKIPPVIPAAKPPEVNGKPPELRPRAPDSLEPRALRRRTWNREDARAQAVLDSLMLNSVSQLSSKIRHSVDKTAGKIRILFKDKDRNWEEIESKLRSESEIPPQKSSNKEIASILFELKRVEKQLQVINVMVDPDGTLDALASLGLASPTTPTQPGSAPAAKQTLPQILPGPGSLAARLQAPPPGREEAVRELGAGLVLAGVGGLSFSRMRPSGEEAIAQK
uniref:Centrosomal protein 170 n=1 Tax=Tetraodon nigroviridis TaxID=99883 RepID=H3C3G4_TETNG